MRFLLEHWRQASLVAAQRYLVCAKRKTLPNVARWLKQNYAQNEEGFVHVCRLDKTVQKLRSELAKLYNIKKMMNKYPFAGPCAKG